MTSTEKRKYIRKVAEEYARANARFEKMGNGLTRSRFQLGSIHVIYEANNELDCIRKSVGGIASSATLTSVLLEEAAPKEESLYL